MDKTRKWRKISLVCSIILFALGLASVLICRIAAGSANDASGSEGSAALFGFVFAAIVIMIISLIYTAVALVPLVIKIVQATTQKDVLSYVTAFCNLIFAAFAVFVSVCAIVDLNLPFCILGLLIGTAAVLGLIADLKLIIAFHS